MGQFPIAKRYPYLIACMLVFLGLYLARFYSYLLFHSLAEIFSIVVACGIFMVTWNSRRFLDNNYLLFLGIAYLFVGGLDLIHTLTYKGMGIFEGHGTNPATQLWIAARYTESVSLLIAPLFIRRKFKINLLFFSYTFALFLILLSIFYWNIFPICFVDGIGLTPFKKISEYVISLILLASIPLLLKNRSEFDRDVLKWVVWSIVLTIASELTFTLYADAYGFFNLLGHFLKIVSFYLIYKALIEMGLTRPYDLLFRNLKQSERMVQEEKNKIQNYLDVAGVILVAIDANQNVTLINKKGCEILGYEEKEIIGKNWFDTFIPEGIREEAKAGFGNWMKGKIHPVEYLENPVLTKTGNQRMIAWHSAVLRDEKGKVVSTFSSGEDITERKQMEEELNRLASFPQLNPNPVVEVDLAGQGHYFNSAAEGLFPDLRKAGLNHPWLMDLEKIGETLKTRPRKPYGRELRVGNGWYQQTIHSVMEGTRLRIYGFDITERKQAEQERERLRVEAENERRRLEAVMEALPVGVAITDAQGGNIRANNAFEQVWGSPRPAAQDVSDYATYKAWWEDTGQLVKPEEWASARAVQKGETVVGQLMQIERFDGTRGLVLNSAAPVLDARGQIIGSAVAIQDITAYRETEMKYSKILATTLSGFWITDPQGRLLEVNDALCRTLGYTHEDLLTLSVADIEATETPADVLNHIAALRQKKFDYFISRHRRKDGSIIDVEVNSTWLDIGEGQLVSFMRDITARIEAEKALKKSKERFELLSETASSLLAIDKPQGVVNDLCQKVMIHLDCHTFFNYLADEEKQRLHLNAYAGIPEETGKEIEWLDYGAAVCGCAARDASRIVCENILTVPDPRTELVKSFGIKAYACHPLFSSGRVIGTLSFGTRSRTTFTDEELSLMKTLADQVAMALEKVSLIDALRKSRDDLEIRVRERTKELREQSRVLDSFFKFSITPFVILDKDFNFVRVNEAYAKACKRKVSEFPGHNHFEFYPSDAKAHFEQVVRTKEPYVAIARPFSFPDHPEWGTSYWDWTLTPILDDAGETEFLVFSLEDVTERKRTEQAVKTERQRFYDLLEMLPAYLVLLSPDYRVPFANRFFRERFGESHGNRCFEYLFDRAEPCEVCETYTVLKTGVPHYWEWTGPDGRIYDVSDFPFTDTDGSTLILEMGIDITERKRAEEALKESEIRLRALSSQLLTAQESERKRIAAELHDSVGQMLTAIKFKVENTLQEKGKGAARAKEKSFEAIIPLVKETLEEVRRMQMDLHPSTLDDLGVLATLGWFCREYQKIYSHIRIEKEIAIQEKEVPAPLKVVVYRLTQEAMNNIAKHSQADFVHLALRKQEGQIEWIIEDNGTGFDLEKILSPEGFEKGLGLSSMRERAELSGGKFMMESTLGKGTTIKASWPS